MWLDIAGVSRRHAQIVIDGQQATLEDLGSKNGTILRGDPLMAATDCTMVTRSESVPFASRIVFSNQECRPRQLPGERRARGTTRALDSRPSHIVVTPGARPALPDVEIIVIVDVLLVDRVSRRKTRTRPE